MTDIHDPHAMLLPPRGHLGGWKVPEKFASYKADELNVWGHWFYFFLKLATGFLTLWALVQFIVLIAITIMFNDTTDLSTYVVNTYYTSNDNEQNVSWQVMTTNPWNGFVRNTATQYADVKNDHYFECLFTAQIGWQACNASAGGTVATYQQCLQSNYLSQINTCGNTSSGYNWPTANIYSNCINNAIPGGSRWTLNALKTCIRNDLWPLYEVPQDVDTTLFLGAYSWPLVMITSFLILLVFGIYTIWPVDFEDTVKIEYGTIRATERGDKSLTRLGSVWLIASILILTFWAVLVLLQAFRSGSVWPQPFGNMYPSTHQTNLIVVTTTLAALFYFFVEAADLSDVKKQVRTVKGKTQSELTDEEATPSYGLPMAIRMPKMFRNNMRSALGEFPDPTEEKTVGSLKSAGSVYTPVLMNTWNDAYLFDPFFFVGAVGATMQVITADVYNIFITLFVTRVLHSGLARLIYESYVRNPAESGEEGKDKDKSGVNGGGAYDNVVFTTRVLAIALHFGIAFLLIIPVWIVFDTTRIFVEFPNLANVFVICLIIPEGIRIIGHMLLLGMSPSKAGTKGVFILLGVQFIWFWDILTRIIFIWIFFWGDPSVRGTKPYLATKNNALAYMLNFTSNFNYTLSTTGAVVTACC